MGPKRILTIAGTRPEAIKLAPLVRLLNRQPGFAHTLVATGQHKAAFHQSLDHFGVAADVDLALPNLSPDGLAAEIAGSMPGLVAAFAPDLVIVQGDTTSAWAAALTAHAAGIPVAHVEAGLRSGNPDLPFPEERNRREIDGAARLLFAPSEQAADNLAGCPGIVHVTGNTGIDALLEMRARIPLTLHDSGRKLILVTCHRREAIPRLPGIARALLRIAARDDVEIVLPVHGNPAVAGPIHALLGGHPRISLEPPMAYPALIRMMEAAHLLLTDSGGLQEEAPALGLPTLILRDNSERPETIACGNARLAGLEPGRIVRAATHLLDHPAAHAAMARPAFPYGRGDSAIRIVAAIARWFGMPTGSVMEGTAAARYI